MASCLMTFLRYPPKFFHLLSAGTDAVHGAHEEKLFLFTFSCIQFLFSIVIRFGCYCGRLLCLALEEDLDALGSSAESAARCIATLLFAFFLYFFILRNPSIVLLLLILLYFSGWWHLYSKDFLDCMGGVSVSLRLEHLHFIRTSPHVCVLYILAFLVRDCGGLRLSWTGVGKDRRH